MSSNEQLIKLHFCAECSELQSVRDTIRSALSSKDITETFIEEVVLAVDEACANIVQHAFKDNQNYTGDIILEIFHNQDEVTIMLTDFADPVDPSRLVSRELNEVRPGGLGVHFMNELMDTVQFLETKSGTGNILEMKKKIRKTQQEK